MGNYEKKIKLSNEADNNYLKIKLNQTTNTFDVLSLKISNEDIYETFNADYGILVGRVTANNGVGIPNALISVFIPISDDDLSNNDVRSIYPYKKPSDKNNEGKRYNLLDRVSTYREEIGSFKPPQPFGSLPIYPEIMVNEKLFDVYNRYYKFTAKTNDAGDYMIFGVPTGEQMIHMSVDITDIGRFSMTPPLMVKTLGYSEGFFSNNNTIIRDSSDLDDLPHIETQEVTVNIQPFWGDESVFEIGITRQDFRIRSQIQGSFIIFGNAFTDSAESMWGDGYNGQKIRGFYRIYPNGVTEVNAVGFENVKQYTKRNVLIDEKFYYYPNSISDGDLPDINGSGGDLTINPFNDINRLNESEYVSIKRPGDFVYILQCNRRKIITGDDGGEIVVGDEYPGGIYTEYAGFMTMEVPETKLNIIAKSSMVTSSWFNKSIYELYPFRVKIKFPQQTSPTAQSQWPDPTYGFFGGCVTAYDGNYGIGPNMSTARNEWIKQYHKFEAGKVYSISKFFGTVYNNNDDNDEQAAYNLGNFDDKWRFGGGFNKPDIVNDLYLLGDASNNKVRCVGIVNVDNTINTIPANNPVGLFGANWLNFSVYIPQIASLDPLASSSYNPISNLRGRMSNTCFYHYNVIGSVDNNMFSINTKEFAGGDIGVEKFIRNDLHWTAFIEVPRVDINNILKTTSLKTAKGFRYFNNRAPQQPSLPGDLGGILTDKENYKYGPIGNDLTFRAYGGRLNGDSDLNPDDNIYFYRGYSSSDCLMYLKELNLI